MHMSKNYKILLLNKRVLDTVEMRQNTNFTLALPMFPENGAGIFRRDREQNPRRRTPLLATVRTFGGATEYKTSMDFRATPAGHEKQTVFFFSFFLSLS